MRTWRAVVLVGMLGLAVLPACHHRLAIASASLGAAFATSGAVLAYTSDEHETGQRTVAYVHLGVAAYLVLVAAIADRVGSEDAVAATRPRSHTTARAPAPVAEPGTEPTTEPITGPVPVRRGASAYDRTLAYAGRSDAHGQLYDRTGAYAGRIDADERLYDRTGAYAGRVDERGEIYDRTGSYAGRVDAQGQLYDRGGSLAGRIDDHGNVYDPTGSYAGRIDGACDEACRRTAAAQILLRSAHP